MIVSHLPRNIIWHCIPALLPHLERFVAKFPAEYDVGHMLGALCAGETAAFLAFDEECNTTVALAIGKIWPRFDGTKQLRMEVLEGQHMREWQKLMSVEIEKFAAANGCNMIRMVGRRGWAKHLPDRVVYNVYERRL